MNPLLNYQLVTNHHLPGISFSDRVSHGVRLYYCACLYLACVRVSRLCWLPSVAVMLFSSMRGHDSFISGWQCIFRVLNIWWDGCGCYSFQVSGLLVSVGLIFRSIVTWLDASFVYACLARLKSLVDSLLVPVVSVFLWQMDIFPVPLCSRMTFGSSTP
jgi:hypothetical protein